MSKVFAGVDPENGRSVVRFPTGDMTGKLLTELFDIIRYGDLESLIVARAEVTRRIPVVTK